MKLDIEKFRAHLKGTPLEGLTEKQINNVVIGEYPLTLSSNHIQSLWRNAFNDTPVEMEYLKWLHIDSLLEAITFHALKNGNNKQYDIIEKIRAYTKKVYEYKGIISFQADIIKQQEKDIFKYELEIRRLKGIIDF